MPFHQEFTDEPFLPVVVCPGCGAIPPTWVVGCQIQDCGKCFDVESSKCKKCGLVVAGANYWRPRGMGVPA